jgi:hypothetical protein
MHAVMQQFLYVAACSHDHNTSVNMHAYNQYLNNYKGPKMPASVRLTKWEQEELRKKCLKLNKILSYAEKRTVEESDLIHMILKKTIKNLEVSKEGEILILVND